MKRTELYVFLAVIAVAALFRLAGLTTTPPGLYPDEAMNGNNALHANRTGDYKLFYPDNNGREGLFINIQAQSIRIFGNSPFALRVVSAVMGILTVVGTYLLTRRLFDDWRLAAIAAFFMATGFWHVNFSRIGFRAIMAPLCTVWGFYYMYRGIETNRLWSWALSGLFFGLGFHTYIAYRVIPGAIILTLIALWLSLRAAFHHEKYTIARHQQLGGIALMVGVLLLVIAPMVAYFYANPQDFTGRTGQVAVWASDNPVIALAKNVGVTLGMFFLHGDSNWRHNMAGQPVLAWPVATFFAAGLLHSLWRMWHSLRARHHPGIGHTLLLSWFFVGLLPAFLSTEGSPHALRALIVAPAVYILAAIGFHWCYLWLERWYGRGDHSSICLPLQSLPGSWGHRVCVGRSTLIVTIAVLSVLSAIGIMDAHRYFVQWGRSSVVADEFTARYVLAAERILALPPSTLKYVVVRKGDVLVQGMPMSSQTIMYLTDTWMPEQQKEKNVYYITADQFQRHQYPRKAIVFDIDPQ